MTRPIFSTTIGDTAPPKREFRGAKPNFIPTSQWKEVKEGDVNKFIYQPDDPKLPTNRNHNKTFFSILMHNT